MHSSFSLCLQHTTSFLQGTKAELKDAQERNNSVSEQQEALQKSKAAYKAELENLQEENELLSRQVLQKKRLLHPNLPFPVQLDLFLLVLLMQYQDEEPFLQGSMVSCSRRPYIFHKEGGKLK